MILKVLVCIHAEYYWVILLGQSFYPCLQIEYTLPMRIWYFIVISCEYTYILGALAKIHSGTQEGSKQTRGDITYAAHY